LSRTFFADAAASVTERAVAAAAAVAAAVTEEAVAAAAVAAAVTDREGAVAAAAAAAAAVTEGAVAAAAAAAAVNASKHTAVAWDIVRDGSKQRTRGCRCSGDRRRSGKRSRG
jgi:hypothetical protein